MSWVEALILGFLQGATEFLPVSSSGHLVMGQALLGLELPGILFEIVVHLATLLSVLVVYRARVGALARGVLVERDPGAWRYLGFLVVATLPVAFVGLLFGSEVTALFEAPQVVGVALLVTALLLFSSRVPLWRMGDGGTEGAEASEGAEAWERTRETGGTEAGRPVVGGAAPAGSPGRWQVPGLGWRVALLVGVAQCFALTPGISRSGTTVVAALWLGVRPVEAAAFSFLLSIPAIGGAAILALPELGGGMEAAGTGPLLLAALTAAVVGVLAIRTFVAMLRNRSFPAFAGYCALAGSAFLLWLAMGSGAR